MVAQVNNMVKVLLIKTEGCQACKIMEDILLEIKFVYKPTNDVDISICDKDFINKDILKIENIKDFPTVLIYDNDCEESHTIVGTVPYKTITSKIEEFRGIR